MYHNSGSLALTGATGGLTLFGLHVTTLWWILLAGFVLMMAGITLLAIVPRRRKQTAKVLPPELRRIK